MVEQLYKPNWKLFNLKKKAHKLMDAQWKSGLMTRGQMYSMLRRELRTQIHIADCNENECKQVIALFSQPKSKPVEKIKLKLEPSPTKSFEQLELKWLLKKIKSGGPHCANCKRFKNNCNCELKIYYVPKTKEE